MQHSVNGFEKDCFKLVKDTKPNKTAKSDCGRFCQKENKK